MTLREAAKDALNELARLARDQAAFDEEELEGMCRVDLSVLNNLEIALQGDTDDTRRST